MANSDLVKSCTWAALKMHILRRQTCEFGLIHIFQQFSGPGLMMCAGTLAHQLQVV